MLERSGIHNTGVYCRNEIRPLLSGQFRSGVDPDWSRVLSSPTGTLNEHPVHTMNKLDNGGILQTFRRPAMQDPAMGTSQRIRTRAGSDLEVAPTRGDSISYGRLSGSFYLKISFDGVSCQEWNRLSKDTRALQCFVHYRALSCATLSKI
jgi:hypothetical protein